MLDRDDLAGVADELVPTLRDGGLDGDPWPTLRAAAPCRGIRRVGTRTIRRTAWTPRSAVMSFSANSLLRLDRELKLGSGADQHDVGQLVRDAAEHVAALGDTVAVGALEHRNALAGKDEPDRAAAVAARKDAAPRVGGLVRVARPHHRQVRDGPQRREVLDGLMGRTVLAEPDRVVGPDVDGVDVHQRGQSHRGAHVVGELQERAAERRVGPCSTMPDRIDPIACSRMPKCSTRPYQSAVKSSVEMDGGPNDFTPLMVVLLLPARSAEPPHSSGSFGATSLSTWPNAARVASGLGARFPVRQVGVPAVGQFLGQQPVQQLLALGFALGPCVELAAATSRGLPCRGRPACGCAR